MRFMREGVSVALVEDVGAVGKMVEWVRVEPRFCRVPSYVSGQEKEGVGGGSKALLEDRVSG